MNLRRNEELGKLQREVLQKAQEYARAQKFDLLLADPNIIFASTAVDVTEAVLAILTPAAAPAGQSVALRSGRAVSRWPRP